VEFRGAAKVSRAIIERRRIERMQIVRMFRIVSNAGKEPNDQRERFEDEAVARGVAIVRNREIGARSNYFRAEPCFVLEVPQEKGPSLFFDLGQPIAAR
jgi:hypothetical protein